MNSESIKIFLSYHKNASRIRSEILTPIHVGRATAEENIKFELQDIIGDNTGDNISDKNFCFCELTAQYWAWKNVNCDKIGFMHYRRQLCFNDSNTYKEDIWGLINTEFVTDEYLIEMGLTDESIIKCISDYDIVTAKPWNVNNAGSKTNYDHYSSSSPYLHIEDYERALKILLRKYPTYQSAVEEYNSSNYGYYTNIFVMKKSLFNQYCEFLFNILLELELNSDITNYNTQEKRIYGYISEWLFGIFITNLKQKNTFKIKELQRTFIQNTDRLFLRRIDVCSCCDDKYAEHLATAMSSIYLNRNRDDNVHYWILSDGISKKHQQIIRRLDSSTFHIHFIDHNISGLKFLDQTVSKSHLSLSAYSRLYLASALPNSIQRVIYLDCDLICRSSLYNLYAKPFDNCSVLGVKDILVDENTARLGLKQYINSGVMLINLAQWRLNHVEKQFIDFMHQHMDVIKYHDQDVINIVLADSIKYVDCTWNAQTSSYISEVQEIQNTIGLNSNIVHFISNRKPWIQNSCSPFEYEYVKYHSLIGIEKKFSGFALKKKNKPVKKQGAREYLLACNYRDGKNVKKDLKKSVKYFKLASAYNQDWVWELFDVLWSIDTSSTDKEMIFLAMKYKDSNSNAMGRLGRAYKCGRGVELNLALASEWFLKASLIDDFWSKELILTVSDLIKLSPAEVISLLSPWVNSEKDYIFGLLGRAYCNIKSFDNLSKSVDYFSKAVNLNNSWVGELFDVLWSMETPNADKEMISLVMRYKDSNSDAMGRLGRAYKCGRGVELNWNLASEWFLKASLIDDFWSKELLELGINQS